MPTKPTIFPRWNTGAANRTAPSGGKVTLGYEPNEKPSSSELNYNLHHLGEAGVWIGAGTSDPDADEHIVETDEDGQANLAYANIARPDEPRLGLDLAPVPGLEVTTDRAACIAIRGTGNTTGVGVHGVGGNAAAGVSGLGGGAAAGLSGVGGATQGPGVSGVGGGTTGVGGTFQGADEGHGVRGIAGEDGGIGGWFTGTQGNPGVLGSGANHASSNGGRFSAGHADAVALQAFSNASGSASGAAIRGDAQQHAVALWGVAGSGTSYALRLDPDASAPGRCHMHLEPLTAVPTGGDDGDFGYIAAGSDFGLLLRNESAWDRVHHSLGGFLDRCEENLGDTQTTNDSSTPVAVVTVSATTTQIRAAGEVIITAMVEVGNSGANTVGLQIWDATAGVQVDAIDVNCRESSANPDERFVCFRRLYTLPAAGARTFQLRYWGGAGTARVRDASLRVEGIY